MSQLARQSVSLNSVLTVFVWFSLYTATISLRSMVKLIFVMKCDVLFEVRKKRLYRNRHAGDKSESSYSSYSFLTPALDGGEWPASRPGRILPPGKGLPVPLR
jgi:hypothetical protein